MHSTTYAAHPRSSYQRLRILEPGQVQFKYCSAFDSTREGNIGPVTEALMERMDAGFTVAVPALPVDGRRGGQRARHPGG